MANVIHVERDTFVPPRDGKRSALNLLVWGGILAALAWSWEGADMRPVDLITDAANMSSFADGFFPPEFHNWPTIVREMIVTVQIAVWGTFLAVVCSVPLALMSSENIVPWWVWQPVRRLMDAARAINEMVFAMLFVVAVGLGPFAGVLAVWVHSTGSLAKLFSEAVEAIDPQPVEGIKATGADPVHQSIYGVIPQVLPLWISYSLYRFEANVRSATVLGIVGAGGIGMILWEYIRGFNYSETAAVIIVVVISVSALDLISQRLRKLVI